MIKKRSPFKNLVIIGFLLLLFNQVHHPAFTKLQTAEKPRTIVNHSDILVTVETPTNVLSGTVADIKILMNNPNKMGIIIMSIEYSYSDYDMSTLYKSRTIFGLTLNDSYEASLHVPIPEMYQLCRVSETDIPISCTVAIRYEENGVEEWVYTSYNMQVFDRFLDKENTERLFNSEPIAIT